MRVGQGVVLEDPDVIGLLPERPLDSNIVTSADPDILSRSDDDDVWSLGLRLRRMGRLMLLSIVDNYDRGDGVRLIADGIDDARQTLGILIREYGCHYLRVLVRFGYRALCSFYQHLGGGLS